MTLHLGVKRSLFEMEIPWMWEFHFKNTNAIFNTTFGFGPGERLGGPKTGWEYSDRRLERLLRESREEITRVFKLTGGTT
jgi:hypothetical protein